MVYKLAVGALFKNEAAVMKEWIEHYLFHGVEHFYLIDDGSTDAGVDILRPYVLRGLVTLFSTAGCGYYLGRQRDLYNRLVLPRLKAGDMEWLLMVDLDEFVWSPAYVDLRVPLAAAGHIGQIQIEHTLFGSAGLVESPPSVVGAYVRRAAEMPTRNPGLRKYFVNSRFSITSLNVHHASFEHLSDEKNHFILDETCFRLNHYCCQSREFWSSIKCTRGDVNNWRVRTMADFDEVDLNDVEDLGLRSQNGPVIDGLRE
jgi:hypothetical protein